MVKALHYNVPGKSRKISRVNSWSSSCPSKEVPIAGGSLEW